MSQYRRYRRGPRQSTKALTVKLSLLAIVATLVIGGMIAAQMAAGNDPALGPKAAARAKTKTTSGSSATLANSASSGDSGTDPNTQTYGYDGYSSGSSSSGYSTQQSTPAPVTSSTS